MLVLTENEICFFINKGRHLSGKRDRDVVITNRTNNELHSTQKPEELIKYLISKSSEKGEVVLDMFMGSGTTAVCALELNREFIGFEINEEYFKTLSKRINEKMEELSVQPKLF